MSEAPWRGGSVHTRRGHQAAGLLAATLLALPVLVGIAYSFKASTGLAGAGATGHASLARLVQVARDPSTWAGLWFTLCTAAAATVLATIAAVAVAVTFRRDGRASQAGRLLAAFPMTIPHVVAGVLSVWTLSQSGTLSRIAYAFGLTARPADMPTLIYDRFGIGMIVTLGWKEAAFMSIVASTLLATRGSDAEEAAQTLGASSWSVFRRVTWPLLWRGLAPAIIAVFVFVLGNYEVAALLAPSNPLALPLLVAERAADPDLTRRGDAYVVSLLLLSIAVATVAVHEWVRARWQPIAP